MRLHWALPLRYSADVLEDFFYFSSGTTMIAGILLTMRLLAEERQHGTDALLLTAPIQESHIVVGKIFRSTIFPPHHHTGNHLHATADSNQWQSVVGTNRQEVILVCLAWVLRLLQLALLDLQYQKISCLPPSHLLLFWY